MPGQPVAIVTTASRGIGAAIARELAKAVAFLHSPGAIYTTSQNLRFDGRLTRPVQDPLGRVAARNQ